MGAGFPHWRRRLVAQRYRTHEAVGKCGTLAIPYHPCRVYYLPTWMVDFYGKCIGKYMRHGWYGNSLWPWEPTLPSFLGVITNPYIGGLFKTLTFFHGFFWGPRVGYIFTYTFTIIPYMDGMAILLVTFLGWWTSDPNSRVGIVTNPTFGDEKVKTESPGRYVCS